MIVKALSIHEPYASLIRTGAKIYETRSWPTKYRGALLICAAKGGGNKARIKNIITDSSAIQKGLLPLFSEKIKKLGDYVPSSLGLYGIDPLMEKLNFGMAVALVEITDCVKNLALSPHHADIGNDKYYGDFSPGMYAWKLKMINNAFEPFPVKGQQRFFDVDVLNSYLD